MIRFNSSRRLSPTTAASGSRTTLMIASASLDALLAPCPLPSSFFPPSTSMLTSVTKFRPFCDVTMDGRVELSISKSICARFFFACCDSFARSMSILRTSGGSLGLIPHCANCSYKSISASACDSFFPNATPVLTSSTASSSIAVASAGVGRIAPCGTTVLTVVMNV